MVRHWLVAFLILSAAATAVQAAGVRAVVDRNRATTGESIALQITIEDGDGEIDLSGLTDFKVLSRGSTSSFQMINGRTSREMIYNYALIPRRQGDLVVPAIPVTIEGKVHRTAPFRIVVSAQPPAESGRRDVYVAAALSESTPWVGQQIIYTFRLFNAVQIADAKFQPPAFNGFNTEELEDRQSKRTLINGREFIVTEVTFILVPLKPGEFTIEPAVLHVGLMKRSRRNRPFAGMDAFFGRGEMVTRMLQTDAVKVNVRPLPPAPPGASFSGLVGAFEIEASLDRTDIRVGDSTTLAVKISGSGNIMDAAAPEIQAPQAFKRYADNPEEAIRKGIQGYSGSKTFRTALVPVQEGEYRIEPIGLTYFDVDSGQYRDIATQAFDVSVAPSAAAVTDLEVLRGASPETPSLKERVEFTGRDILPLKEDLAAIESSKSMSLLWFAIFLVLPPFGFGIVGAILQMVKKDESPERIMADRAKEALKTASSRQCSDEEFLSSLYRALVSAILGKQGAMGTSLTWSEAQSHLQQLGWEERRVADTAHLLETIESFNYSGQALDNTQRTGLLDRTRQTVRRLTR
jgi:hypothetical protein